jgi:hypothetical protein
MIFGLQELARLEHERIAAAAAEARRQVDAFLMLLARLFQIEYLIQRS